MVWVWPRQHFAHTCFKLYTFQEPAVVFICVLAQGSILESFYYDLGEKNHDQDELLFTCDCILVVQ